MTTNPKLQEIAERWASKFDLDTMEKRQVIEQRIMLALTEYSTEPEKKVEELQAACNLFGEGTKGLQAERDQLKQDRDSALAREKVLRDALLRAAEEHHATHKDERCGIAGEPLCYLHEALSQRATEPNEKLTDLRETGGGAERKHGS